MADSGYSFPMDDINKGKGTNMMSRYIFSYEQELKLDMQTCTYQR